MVDWSKLEPVKTEADYVQEEKRVAGIAYLKSTDWYIIRKVETEIPVPDEISEKRRLARLNI